MAALVAATVQGSASSTVLRHRGPCAASLVVWRPIGRLKTHKSSLEMGRSQPDARPPLWFPKSARIPTCTNWHCAIDRAGLRLRYLYIALDLLACGFANIFKTHPCPCPIFALLVLALLGYQLMVRSHNIRPTTPLEESPTSSLFPPLSVPDWPGPSRMH